MSRFFILRLIKIISFLPSSLKLRFLNEMLKAFNEKDLTYYYTINYRDKFFKEGKKVSSNNNSIIIQGPILRKDNFTINTINLYQKSCKSKIILSTWENELSQNEISNLKKRDVKIIINKLPKVAGPSNINFQLKSTSEALKYSLKIGSKFSIKTRTDCRIYLNNFDENLLKFYNYYLKKNSKLKLGSTSLTRAKRLFGISDIFMFGTTKELLNYFPQCCHQKEFENFKRFLNNIKNKDKNFLKDSYSVNPENFLNYNYICKNISKKTNYNSKDYYRCLKNFFLIIDNSVIDFFWYKYNHQLEFRDKEFTNKNLYAFLSHLKWLRI